MNSASSSFPPSLHLFSYFYRILNPKLMGSMSWDRRWGCRAIGLLQNLQWVWVSQGKEMLGHKTVKLFKCCNKCSCWIQDTILETIRSCVSLCVLHTCIVTVSVSLSVSLASQATRASPSVRCDYPSFTSAVHSNVCIHTVCSFTQNDLSSIPQSFCTACGAPY